MFHASTETRLMRHVLAGSTGAPPALSYSAAIQQSTSYSTSIQRVTLPSAMASLSPPTVHSEDPGAHDLGRLNK